MVRYFAVKNDFIAYPTQERWHKKPTALLGGIAIYLAAAIPIFFIADFHSLGGYLFKTSVSKVLPSLPAVTWLGMTILFMLGLIDDYFHIKPHIKLFGQIVVASLVAFLGFRMHWFDSLTLDTLVTIFWIVGITNAFNLIDNMDGLCAGIGFIAAAFLSILFFKSSPYVSITALIIAGSLLGFLLYNFNPASIFMGDSGSLLIGFSMSMLSLYYFETGATNIISLYAVPILILMVPIFDTTMVTFIRILSGRKASVGGKDHTSHRLVIMGFSEKGAVLFLYGIAFFTGISSLFVSINDTFTSPTVIIPVAISIVLMGIYLSQLRVYPEKEFSLLRDKTYTPILIQLTYKKQIMLVIMDFFLIAFAYYLSYRLRFESEVFSKYFKVFLKSLPAVIACKFVAFFIIRIYKGFWKYVSINDAVDLIKASTLASILSIAAVTFFYRFQSFSKGIFVIDWVLTTVLLLGTRGSFRLFTDSIIRRTLRGDKIIIYGAGRGGEMLLREILNNKKLNVIPHGFIDDDSLKKGKKIQGYPIVGTSKELDMIIDKEKINGILLSFNPENSSHFENVKEICRNKGIFLKQFLIKIEEINLGI
ncbi:MAG: glycosyl transferase [Desulfobacterales bacterium]|nr:glycosyl transferase [Desulfobacterales bacterium]